MRLIPQGQATWLFLLALLINRKQIFELVFVRQATHENLSPTKTFPPTVHKTTHTPCPHAAYACIVPTCTYEVNIYTCSK